MRSLSWILGHVCAALTACLKTSPFLPPIGGFPPPPSKSWLMTSRGRKLCSFVSYKVQGSADREAFRASADTEASEREVAVIKGDADIQNLW